MERKDAGAEQITQNMRQLLNERMGTLTSYYCREDLQAIWDNLKSARGDQKIYLLRNFRAVCKALNLEDDQFLKNAQYREQVIQNTPPREELLDKLVSLLYDIAQQAPSSEVIMERLVHRLAPDFKDGSVRLAILKQFVLKCGFTCETINIEPVVEWAKARMSEEELEHYEQQTLDDEKLRRVIAKLDDSIFNIQKQTVRLSDLMVLKIMLKRVDKLQKRILEDQEHSQEQPSVTDENGNPVELNDISLTAATRANMLGFCSRNGLTCREGASSLEIMRMICESFQNGRLPPDTTMEPFFKNLKNEFNAHLRGIYCLTGRGNWKSAKDIFDDDLRDARRRIQNAAKQGNAGASDLVRLCDNLAQSRFLNNNGKTRIYLFWFALVFGMTVNLDDNSERNDETDMIKNLFEDYYNDNLLRYMKQQDGNGRDLESEPSGEDHDLENKPSGNGRDLESEPSGEGLNFKNYVEAIYLYYIVSDLPKTPGEKIDAAERAIRQCRSEAQRREEEKRRKEEAGEDGGAMPQVPSDREPTRVFRDNFRTRILGCDEQDLVCCIVDNYRILGDARGMARVMLASETNTAYSLAWNACDEWESDLAEESAQESVEEPAEDSAEKSAQGADLLAEITEDLRRTSMGIDSELLERIKDRYSVQDGEEQEKAKRFLRLVDNLHNRMSAEFSGISKRQTHFLLYLLRVLAHQDQFIGTALIKDELRVYGIVANANMIHSGARLLKEAGFKIERDDDNQYCLTQREYGDLRRKDIMCWAALMNMRGNSAEEKLHALLWDTLSLDKKRVTRSMLVAQLANAYIANLPDKSILSFPVLYRDFTAYFNPKLIEARYQPISTKNILDMYVLVSIFSYLVVNGTEPARNNLRSGDSIYLSLQPACTKEEEYRIIRYVVENNTVIRYHAKRCEDEHTGRLYEFFPFDLADQNGSHYSLVRLGNGTLVPTGHMEEDFQRKCKAFVQKALQANTEEKTILYSCWREGGAFCQGSVYIWIPDKPKDAQ